VTAAINDPLGAPGARGSLRIVVRAMRLIRQAHPVAAGMLLAGTLVIGAAPVGIAWLTKLLIDALLGPRRDTSLLVSIGVGLAVATLILRLFPEGLRYLQRQLDRRVEYVVRDRMFTKVNTFGGVRLFEQPRFHDLLQLALDSGQNAPQRILGVFGGILQQTVTLLGFIGILVAIHPLVAVFTVLSTLPQLVAELSMGRHRVQVMVRVSPAERRRFFFSSLLIQPHAAKELRLFGLGSHFRRRMLDEVSSIHAQERALDVRALRIEAMLGMLAAVTWGATLAVVVGLAATNRIGAGDLVAFLAAIAAVSGGFAALFGDVAQAAEAVHGMGYYERLLDAEPDIRVGAGRPAPPLRDAIELRDVWFRYDPDQPWVLKGVNLRIPAGQSLAIVGQNGSGKSTVVKLLCRLYAPDRGAVLWDGVDIAEYDIATLRERMGSVFQDFMRYDLTVADNIGLGDLERLHDEERIRSAAQLAGVGKIIDGLPHGYGSVLSRVYVFEGADDTEAVRSAELSGGQWQRLALARMLMRDDRDLLLLDEPSSGLDPQAEHELHATVHSLTGGRTRVLVSHRLNAVRAADRIAVLSDGHVIEAGTHDELTAASGAYARMFELQRSGYAGWPGPPASVAPEPTAHDRDHPLLGERAESAGVDAVDAVAEQPDPPGCQPNIPTGHSVAAHGGDPLDQQGLLAAEFDRRAGHGPVHDHPAPFDATTVAVPDRQ
jgi:ATP-binding cassette subfamily B protein